MLGKEIKILKKKGGGETCSLSSVFYSIFCGLCRFACWVYYDGIQVHGTENIQPDKEALIFCVTHRNGIFDMMILISALRNLSKAPIRILASAGLFQFPLLALVLSLGGAIPVHRKLEFPNASPETKNRMIQRAAECLRGSEFLAMCPEGFSHDEFKVQKLRRGVYRIAQEFYNDKSNEKKLLAGEKKAVFAVPVGISYEDKASFRSKVIIVFGSPLEIPRGTGRCLSDTDVNSNFLDRLRSCMQNLSAYSASPEQYLTAWNSFYSKWASRSAPTSTTTEILRIFLRIPLWIQDQFLIRPIQAKAIRRWKMRRQTTTSPYQAQDLIASLRLLYSLSILILLFPVFILHIPCLSLFLFPLLLPLLK